VMPVQRKPFGIMLAGMMAALLLTVLPASGKPGVPAPSPGFRNGGALLAARSALTAQVGLLNIQQAGGSRAYRGASRYSAPVAAAEVSPAAAARQKRPSQARQQEFDVPNGENPPPRLMEGYRTPPTIQPRKSTRPQTLAPPAGPDSGTPEPSTEFDTFGFTGFRPPDCALAAGPAHLVSLVNAHMQIRNLAGVQIGSQVSLVSFFPIDTTGFIFDPRVSYDPMSGRFILVAAGRFDNDGSAMTPTLEGTEQSTLVIAVSATSDPTGTWRTYSFNIRRGSVAGGDLQWGDYPSLGWDQQAIYVTFNMLQFAGATSGGGNRLITLNKAMAIAGNPLTPVIVEDVLLPSPPFAAGSTVSTPKPVETAGPLSPYLMTAAETAAGGVGVGIALYKVTDPLALGGGPFISVSHIASAYQSAGNAAQPGATMANQFLEAFGTRLQKTSYRNGVIWTSHQVSNDGSIGGPPMCRFYRIDPTGAGSLLDTDDITDATRNYFYPAICPDPAGNAIAVMAASSSTEFASIYHTRYDATTGAFEPPVLLEAGTVFYQSLVNGRNRWGDYFDCSLDVNEGGTSVWVQGELPVTGTTWKMRAARVTSTFTAAVGPNIAVNTTNLTFGTLCSGETADRVLQVFNTGDATLHLQSITRIAGSLDFAIVAGPPLPTTIAPGSHVDYTIRLTPTGSGGAKTATFRITSDDLDTTTLDVTVGGVLGSPEIVVQGCPVNFGLVPLDDAAAHEKEIQICNQGDCPLTVTGIAFNPATTEFTLVETAPTAGSPLVVGVGACVPFHIRFTPTSCGPKSATLVIQSDDPATPSINCPVQADSACADVDDLDAPAGLCFPPTVVQSFGSCYSEIEPAISNKGAGKMRINSVTLAGANPGDYELVALPSMPVFLNQGDVLGAGDFAVRFRPTEVARNRAAVLEIVVADPISGAALGTVQVPLGGEGVRPGARLLVRQNGAPVASIYRVVLWRSTEGQGFHKITELKNVPLKNVNPGAPCPPFQYHVEYGGVDTVGEPTYLRPGEYRFEVTLKIGNKQVKKLIDFGAVDSCSFNANLRLDF